MDLNRNYSFFSVCVALGPPFPSISPSVSRLLANLRALVRPKKIPLAYIMVLGAETYGKMLAVKQVDNANPRQFHDTIAKSDKVDKITKGRILRSHHAATNGYETLSLFTGAVITSNIAGVPVSTINLLSLAYLGSRALYNFIYIHLQENRKYGPVRSVVWMASVGCWFTLYIQAGLRAMRAS
ncbi:hypothetical protein PG984_002590 [Apiospora sp. TS-2023a]